MPDSGWAILLIGAIVCPFFLTNEAFYWGFALVVCALFRVLVALDAFGQVLQKMGVVSKPLLVADLYLVILGSTGMFLVEWFVHPLYGNKMAAGCNILIFLSVLAVRSIYRRAIIRRTETEKDGITSSNL